MKRSEIRLISAFAFLLVLLCVLLLLNLFTGSVRISPGEVLQVLKGAKTAGEAATAGGAGAALGTATAGGAAHGTAWVIVRDLRLPRLLAAALLGGALALSGFLLQTFFSNPIAGPFVLGISSGAKLLVALTMISCLGSGVAVSSGTMILTAFAGSLLVMGVILLVSGHVKSMSVLVVCGVMVGYLCSAVTEFAMTFADDSNIVNLHSWSMGSFSGISAENLRWIAGVSLGGLLLAFLLSKPMGAWQMGEGYAKSMGVSVKKFRAELILLSSLLSGAVTAFAGPVSFVGIAVPHLMKRLCGTAKPIVMVPACFLGGADFCLFCDLLARSLFAPTEISISSVTAVFGAPVVIWMLLAGRR